MRSQFISPRYPQEYEYQTGHGQTGTYREWYATLGIGVDEDTSQKPENHEKVAGIDVGILKYAHDTDGHAIESPDSVSHKSG